MKAFSIYVIAFILAVAGPQLARSDHDDDGRRHGHRHGYGYGHQKHGHCESLVSDWSDWGSCSASCEGVGVQTRTKTEFEAEMCDNREVPCQVECDPGYAPDAQNVCQPCTSSDSGAELSDVFCRIKAYQLADILEFESADSIVRDEDDCIQACAAGDCRAVVYIETYPAVCRLYSVVSMDCGEVEHASDGDDVRLYVRKSEFPGETCITTPFWLEFDPALLQITSGTQVIPRVIGGDFCSVSGYQFNTGYPDHGTTRTVGEQECFEWCQGAQCRAVYTNNGDCWTYSSHRLILDHGQEIEADVIANNLAGTMLAIRKEEFLNFECPSSVPWTVITPTST